MPRSTARRDVAKPWRLFDVEIQGFGSSVVQAPTRSAAMYDRYLAFSDPWPCTFAEFLKVAKVRSGKLPAEDGYAYVRRAYGLDVKVGQRVEMHSEGPRYNGRQGVVMYPGKSSTSYVHVLLDGEESPCVVHPNSVRLLSMLRAGETHG